MGFVGKVMLGTLIVFVMGYGACDYMVSSKMDDLVEATEYKSVKRLAEQAGYNVENCKSMFNGSKEFWCIKAVEQGAR